MHKCNLWSAAEHGDFKTVQRYLNTDPDQRVPSHIDAFAKHGAGKYRTPLALAAQHGHAAIVGVLLEAGVDVDAAKDDANGETGTTALYEACCHAHSDIVLQLLAHGADPAKRVLASQLFKSGYKPADMIGKCASAFERDADEDAHIKWLIETAESRGQGADEFAQKLLDIRHELEEKEGPLAGTGHKVWTHAHRQQRRERRAREQQILKEREANEWVVVDALTGALVAAPKHSVGT